jgi:ribosomal protein S18 acetylase RimI-like enzyme
MIADFGEQEPAPPEPIAGVEIQQFDPADAQAVHDAVDEAFAHEWGFTPMPHDEWVSKRMGRSDPTLWRVAHEDGSVVGATVLDWKRFGVGWVGAIAVRPAWRRRGIGYALLQESFREFHRRGERRVGLGVDTENPTGATRLYERAGMRTLFQATIFEKELR